MLHTIIFWLIIFEIAFAMYLSYNHYAYSGICSIGSCDTVQSSAYGSLFGISLNYLAVVAFILLFICYKKNTGLYIIGITVGSLTALYLIYLQLFVLNAICSNCMVIDGVMIVIAILSFSSEKYRKHLKGVFGNK